jgi:hypothetical protein
MDTSESSFALRRNRKRCPMVNQLTALNECVGHSPKQSAADADHGDDSWLSGAVERAMKADPTFPRVTAHDLRRTYASLAISLGANVLVVQRQLGHRSAAVTTSWRRSSSSTRIRSREPASSPGTAQRTVANPGKPGTCTRTRCPRSNAVICSGWLIGTLCNLHVRHSSITVTTGTYVEVIEAVQRDALDSMGALFEQVGDESSGRLSSKKSRLSSNARKSGP